MTKLTSIRPLFGVAIVLAIGFTYVIDNPYYYHVGTMVGIMGLAALSLHLMLRVGQVSFIQTGFMLVGAYVSALLSMRLNYPIIIAMLGSGFITMIFAIIIAPVVLKLRDLHFVLLTFAGAEILKLIAEAWVGLTGGNNGLFNIPGLQIGNLDFDTPIRWFTFSSVIFLVAGAGIGILEKSRVGVVMDALRNNEVITIALGVHSMQWRAVIFALSGGLAGFAGACYAHFIGFISPEAFGLQGSVNLLAMNVLGGLDYLGAMMGAALLVPIPEALRGAQQYEMLIFGVIIVVVVAKLPEGITGFAPIRRKVRRGPTA